MRLAIVASHPIQYQAPLFRALAKLVELNVYFAHKASRTDQAGAGYGVEFEWDTDLLSGYRHEFLVNVSKNSGTDHFSGCDTPEIGARVQSGGFDAVLVMGWHLKSMWQTILAAQRRRVPLLVRSDSQLDTPRSWLKRLAKRLVYPPALRLFDGALYVGQRSKKYYEYYGYPAHRLFFSPHCVDTKWFAERSTRDAGRSLRAKVGIDPEQPVALFAGRLVDFKRPLDLVAALELLGRRDRKVSLLIAGSGPLEREIRIQAQTSGVSAHFLGFQNQSAMPAVYAAADVLVLPSTGAETWGLVANEALACGKPIVVSDAVGCASDLAEDGSSGRVYPMEDRGRLADALSEVLRNPPPAAAIAKKLSVYSVDAACKGIVQALGTMSRLRPSRIHRVSLE
jgi:glycosyltransferase involved in cell wall biosynthesis